MQREALLSVLLIKAVEETDRAGTLIPPADRAAATREALREPKASAAPDSAAAGAYLPAPAQRLLTRRAALLHGPLAVRFPFVDTVLALARGPSWGAWLLAGLALALGFALSALDGGRRINILAFPLLGLVLWNLIVYALVMLEAWRSLVRRSVQPAVPAALVALAVRRCKRLVARAAAFNTALAEALGRFVVEWSEAARPLLIARAVRLFHLCAAAVGLGLIAGLYLRGVALDYRAGWESTFLDAPQARSVIAVLYGPASALTGIGIPDTSRFAALRFEGEGGGESAAPWIHLLAATALLFVVLPRLLLALAATVAVRRRSRRALAAPGLVAYFRWTFGLGAGGSGRVAVIPYAYDPSPSAQAVLRRLLPDALGAGVETVVQAGARYGDEDDLLRQLGDRGAGADVIAILLSLAATPEDENHGTVIAGVRDWIERERRRTHLLVLVDEGPYLARMQGGAAADRVGERRELWRRFVAARGLQAGFVDLRQPDTVDPEDARSLRAMLWQPATHG